MSQHVTTVRARPALLEIRVYQTDEEWEPGHYYWCCEECGNCSLPMTTISEAVDSARFHEHYPEEDNDTEA